MASVVPRELVCCLAPNGVHVLWEDEDRYPPAARIIQGAAGRLSERCSLWAGRWTTAWQTVPCRVAVAGVRHARRGREAGGRVAPGFQPPRPQMSGAAGRLGVSTDGDDGVLPPMLDPCSRDDGQRSESGSRTSRLVFSSIRAGTLRRRYGRPARLLRRKVLVADMRN
jgi:hypothetical protein